MNIIILNESEQILTFLDSDLLDITETFEDGLRSIDVEYNIEELQDANDWFKLGHKMFIVGDSNLTDCLYVLNTEVKQDLFDKNQFSFTAEEVLVELNYAPFFTQNQLSNPAFTTTKKDGETAVTVNYNSLNYWFGDYFNIGIIQDCLSDYTSKIIFTGSMSLMNLLRYIEEETGNVFVTRYEKDILSNTVHRYLDFLNPVSQNKNWSTYFEYDFIAAPDGAFIIDEYGNPADYLDDDPLDDDQTVPNEGIMTNIDITHLQFRITKDGKVIKTDNQTRLAWNASDIGLTSTDKSIAIQLRYQGNKIGIRLHNKSYTVPQSESSVGGKNTTYIATIANDPTYINSNVLIQDGSCFEFYDTDHDRVVYSRTLNPILSEARTEILDLGYNVENIEFSTDESDTFVAISPVLTLDKNASNSLSSDDMNKIVKNWLALEVEKGDIIPMFVERVSVTGTDAHKCSQRTGTASAPKQSAEQILGVYVLSKNYYSRPLKPNDNTEGDNKTYEYFKGGAYWKAPFRKAKNSFYLELESSDGIDYSYIKPRTDIRSSRSTSEYPKMGQVETSEENVYNIYNAVAMKLKEKKDPKFDITVDVANYRDGLFNNYNIHDKVYVKLPGTQGLVIAKVVKTVKSLHDISENKIVLDNYSINTKDITADTYMEVDNISFKYPKTKNLKVTLKNTASDDDKLSNKLITFVLYKVENGNRTSTGKIYTKKTNSNGECTLTCKYQPGNYEMDISFGGDAEYSETSTTALINVTGTYQKADPKNNNKNKSNSGKNSTKKYKLVKRYWDKYGVSPDKKTVKAIGRASARGELEKYGYTFYETEFENYCPKCHKKGTLFWDIFWAGNEYSDWGHVRKTGNGEGSSAEGAVFCSNGRCDGDWSIFGKEHGYSNTRLRVKKKTKSSSKSKAYQLRKGKLYYDTQKVLVKTKKVTNKTKRVIKGNPSKKIRNLALSIVGNSTGYSALMKICKYMDDKIKYKYYCGFCRSPDKVVSTKHGNCCDGTRLFLELADAAGLTEYYDMYYVWVTGHVYAQIKSKKTGNRVYIDCASTLPCYGYVCQGYTHGSPTTTYPNRPNIGCSSC